ncbi:COQ9 family protein [Asticcacaulis sp. BYS171W]|uniref:COQ9 family protein n=1 Tax=Asticcacaulis aquaticus TaxID=2984212 RepID=A0ABT5HTS4_9CAUL|nr:COQ9 family protein [Asticcacaulis aquaticus]MDC7683476.1 COQ9 family protein [Asticcacaulis aquaticus]
MTDALTALETELAHAVAAVMPDLGLNSLSVRAGAKRIGLSDAEVALVCPNGPADIAAILWREGDHAVEAEWTDEALAGLKIREKIATLLRARLAAACVDEAVTHRLIGHLCLPQHLGLYKRLLWDSADLIWRKAGDTALDENHYSKRLIVSGILATALMTRLTRGLEAQNEQIDRNIDQVMAFEKWKAKLPFKPETALLNVVETLGKLRFGSAA